MITLKESLLDNEEDILNDDTNIMGLDAALKFMKAYFPYRSRTDIGELIYRSCDLFSSHQHKGITDAEFKNILDDGVWDLRDTFDEHPGNEKYAKAFFNQLKYAYHQDIFHFDILESLNDETIPSNIDGMILKPTDKNLNDIKHMYTDDNPWIIAKLKASKQFTYIMSEGWGEFYIIIHPKGMAKMQNEFMTEFFKVYNKCK